MRHAVLLPTCLSLCSRLVTILLRMEAATNSDLISRFCVQGRSVLVSHVSPANIYQNKILDVLLSFRLTSPGGN